MYLLGPMQMSLMSKSPVRWPGAGNTMALVLETRPRAVAVCMCMPVRARVIDSNTAMLCLHVKCIACGGEEENIIYLILV